MPYVAQWHAMPLTKNQSEAPYVRAVTDFSNNYPLGLEYSHSNMFYLLWCWPQPVMVVGLGVDKPSIPLAHWILHAWQYAIFHQTSQPCIALVSQWMNKKVIRQNYTQSEISHKNNLNLNQLGSWQHIQHTNTCMVDVFWENIIEKPIYICWYTLQLKNLVGYGNLNDNSWNPRVKVGAASSSIS